MVSHEWEEHKSTIVYLFCIEKRRLDKISIHMKERYNFDKKKSQYEYQLKKWGVKKNVPKEVWQYIDHQIQKRGARKTEVRLFDRPTPISEIARDLKRHRKFPTALEFGKSIASPKTPDGGIVRVASPVILHSRSVWPKTLPWFQFREKVTLTVRQPSVLIESVLKAEGFSDALVWTSATQLPTSEIAATNPLSPYASISRLANSVPELHEGEHREAQELLYKGDAQTITTELLKAVLFRLSNNLDGQLRDQDDQREHDQFILHLIEEVSKSDLDLLLGLLSTDFPTTNAIKEAIYGCAIRERRHTVVSQLLEAGVNPDLQVFSLDCQALCVELARGQFRICTANQTLQEWMASGLQIAAATCDIELGRRLLSAGASADADVSSLALLLRPERRLEDTWEFAHLLLDNGAKANFPPSDSSPSPLAIAIARKQNVLAELLIKNGANPNSETPENSWEYHCCGMHFSHNWFRSLANRMWAGEMTLLQVAIMADNTEVANKLLLPVLAQDIALPSRYHKDVLLTACLAGDLSTAAKVLNPQVNLNSGWRYGLTPLVAAAWNPDIRIASMLLQSGAHINPVPGSFRTPSALHVAAFHGNVELVGLLIDQGANCNLPYRLFQENRLKRPSSTSTPLQLALESGNRTTVSLILPHANLLGGELGQAIKLADEGLISDIITKGASIVSADVLEAAAEEEDLSTIVQYFRCGGKYTSPALFAAVENAALSGNHSIVQLLVNHRPEGVIDRYEASALVLSILESKWLLPDLLLGGPFLPGPQMSAYQAFTRGRFCSTLEYKPDDSDPGVSPFLAALASKNISVLEKMLHHGYYPQESDLVRLQIWYELKNAALEMILSVSRSLLSIPTLDLGCRQGLFSVAVENGDMQLVQQCRGFVESVDFYFTDALDGETPLQAAAKMGHLPLFQFLVDAGAAVNAPAGLCYGATALQRAVINGNFDMVMFLLDRDANIDALPAELGGRTALEAAAEHGRLDMIQLFLERHADIHGAMRICYVRSVALARKNGHYALAEHLIKQRSWTEEEESLLLYGTQGLLDDETHVVYDQAEGDWNFRKVRDVRLSDGTHQVVYDDEDASDSEDANDSEGEGEGEGEGEWEQGSEPESSILRGMDELPGHLRNQVDCAEVMIGDYIDSSLWYEEAEERVEVPPPISTAERVIVEVDEDADLVGTHEQGTPGSLMMMPEFETWPRLPEFSGFPD
ncbi:Uu.00g118650.m01.CDS01 [Anthostomella pinea]|uniref:Uu.00g118650.m01.CDS01 n=1 Tax=Anthostomella pinea TaxID=933095 RepID=A0AAI8YH24_9PEZI|nr:Uu.00g118650.m01.CDS01 [Anthostomella pinea]